MNEGLRQTGPDFLGRLIDKALGHSGAVVPRLPSVFETLQPVPVPANPEWEMSVHPHEEVEVEVHAEGQIARPVVSKPGENSSRAVSAGGEPDKVRFNRLPDDVPRGTIQAEAEAGEQAPAAVMASSRPLPSRVEGHSFAQPVREFPFQNHNKVTPVAERPSEVLSAAARPIRVEFVDREAPVFSMNSASSPFIGSIKVDEDDGATSKGKYDVTSPLHNSFLYTSLTGVMIPKARPVVAVRSASLRRAVDRQAPWLIQKVEAEPTVNVTIGRIEVRAVADRSNVVPRKNESHGPKPMSLDEYLKQGGGGR